MPLPLLFIGIAAATGSFGIGKTVKAGVDVTNASHMNKNAQFLLDKSTERLNCQRKACGDSLENLGKEKIFILNNSMNNFIDTFSKIKNIDFTDSLGLDELKEIHLDKKDFAELKVMVNFATSVAGGAAAGSAGGALVAFGAYGAAQTLACASTGTAIASLSGAAATNATLAFFGGGSLAVNGLGMAGGAVILGGLVAGPALMVMGLVAGEAAKKQLEKARTNMAEAVENASQLDAASIQCETIRRRTYMLYNLLTRLDTFFLPLVYKMENIVKEEGDDYSKYTTESKKAIASCASIAVTIKAVLDTPILTDDGLLTDKSEETTVNVKNFLKNMKIEF